MGGGSFEFQFINGTLPLTVYWDKQAFYSDSLPFADQSPAPRAEGYVGTGMVSENPDGSLCGSTDFILMSDTTYFGDTGDGVCIRSDSIVYFNYQGPPNLGMIYQFEIRPWTGKLYSSVPEITARESVNIYPNPAGNFIAIDHHRPSEYQLYHINGKTCQTGKLTGSHSRISIRDCPPGSYILQIKTEDQSIAKQILIIR